MGAIDPIVVTHIRNEELHKFEVFFQANALTERFLLNQGGFTEQFRKEQEEINEEKRIDILNKQKLESEIDIINFQKGLGKKLTIWGFIIAIVSVLASILTTIISDNKASSEDTRINTLEIKIKAMRTQIKLLEINKNKTTTATQKL